MRRVALQDHGRWVVKYQLSGRRHPFSFGSRSFFSAPERELAPTTSFSDRKFEVVNEDKIYAMLFPGHRFATI
jgi:hypothetical protein